MSAALAYLEDDLQMPRRVRHLYLVAVNGHIVAPNGIRRLAACMRTGTSALLSDVLDRAKSTTLPDGTTTTMEYGFDKVSCPRRPQAVLHASAPIFLAFFQQDWYRKIVPDLRISGCFT